jgi:hypothetical protein
MSEITNLKNIAQAASYAMDHSIGKNVAPEIIESEELQYIRRVTAKQFNAAIQYGEDITQINPEQLARLYEFKYMIENLPASFVPENFSIYRPEQNDNVEPAFLRASLLNIFDQYFYICAELEKYETNYKQTHGVEYSRPQNNTLPPNTDLHTLGKTILSSNKLSADVSDLYTKYFNNTNANLSAQLDLLELIGDAIAQAETLEKADLPACFYALNHSDSGSAGLINVVIGYYNNALDTFMGKPESAAVPKNLNIVTLITAADMTARRIWNKLDEQAQAMDITPATLGVASKNKPRQPRQINSSRQTLQARQDLVAKLLLDAARLNQSENLYNNFMLSDSNQLVYFGETSPVATLKKLVTNELEAGDKARADGDLLGAYIHYQNAEDWLRPEASAKYLNLDYVEKNIGFLDDTDKRIWEITLNNLKNKLREERAAYQGEIIRKLKELEDKVADVAQRLDERNLTFAGRLKIIAEEQACLELYYQLKEPAENFWRENVFAKMETPQDLLGVVSNSEFKNQAARYLEVLPDAFAAKVLSLLKNPQVRNNNQGIIGSLYNELTREYERSGNKNRWWPKTIDDKVSAYRLLAFLQDQIGTRNGNEAPPVLETPEIVKQAISASEPVVIPRSGETSSTFKNIPIDDLRETSGGIYKITDQDGYNQAEATYQSVEDARDTAAKTMAAKEGARDTAALAQEKAQSDKDLAQEAVDNSNDAVKDWEGEIKSIQGDVDGAQTEVTAAAEAVSKQEGIVTGKQDEVNTAQGEYDAADKDYTAKTTTYTQAVAAVPIAEGVVTAAETARDKAAEEYSQDSTQANYDALQAAEQALLTARQDLSAAETAAVNAEKAKDTAENTRDLKLDALNNEKDLLKDAQTELNDKMREHSAAQKQLTAANNQLTKAQEKLKEAQDALINAQENDLKPSEAELAAKEQALEKAQKELEAAQKAAQDAQTTLDNTAKPNLRDFSTLVSSLDGEALADLFTLDKQGNSTPLSNILTGSLVMDSAGNIIGFYCTEIDPVSGAEIAKFWYITPEGILKEAEDVEISIDANGQISITAKGDTLRLYPGGPEIGYINNTNILGSMLKVNGFDRTAKIVQVSNATGAFLAKEIEIIGPDGQKTKKLVPIESGDIDAELQKLLVLTQTGVDPDTGEVYYDLSVPPEIISALVKNGYVLLLTGDSGEKALGVVDIVGAENITAPAKIFQRNYSTTSPLALLSNHSGFFSMATLIPNSDAGTTSDPGEATGKIYYGGTTINFTPEEMLSAGILINPKTGTIYIAGEAAIETTSYDANLGKIVQSKTFNGALDPQIVKEVERTRGGDLELNYRTINPGTMTRDFFDTGNSIFELYQDGQSDGLLLDGKHLRFDDLLVQEAMQEIKAANAAKGLGTGYEDFPTLLTLVYLKQRYKNTVPTEAKQQAQLLKELEDKYGVSLSAEELEGLSLHDLATQAAANVVLDGQNIAVFSSAKNGVKLGANAGLEFSSLGVENLGVMTPYAGFTFDWQNKFGLLQAGSTYYLDNITGASGYNWSDLSASRLASYGRVFLNLAENLQFYLSYFNESFFPHNSDEWSAFYHSLGAGLRGKFFLGRLGNSALGKDKTELSFDLLAFNQLLALEENGNQYNNTGVTGKVDLKLGAFTLGLDSTLFWRNHWFLADSAMYRAVPEDWVSSKFYPRFAFNTNRGPWDFGAEIGWDFAKGSLEQKLNVAYHFSRFTVGLSGHASQYFFNSWLAPLGENDDPGFGGGGSLFVEKGNSKLSVGANVQPSGNVDITLGFTKRFDLFNTTKK